MPNFTLGWLPAVLPAGARRFRAHGAALAAALEDAGGELVDTGPDVEIGSRAEQLVGDARVAVVSIEPVVGAELTRGARAAAKLLAAARVPVRTSRERAGLRRLGYSDVSTLRWDVRRPVRLPGLPAPRRSPGELLSTGALIVGTRGSPGPTALDAALDAAGREAGLALRRTWASIRPGPLLVATSAGVLRAAIGQGRVEIESQIAALDALGRTELAPTVAVRLPRLLGHGREGLVRWSLERALPGRRPAELTPALLDECVAFLIALHAAGGEGGATLAGDAETVAAACGEDGAARARALGARLDRELAEVPRGFAHGDFFAGNLLADGESLTGVLDWDAGGPGRLPLVDLLHLQLTRIPYGTDEDWGRAVLERLLPAASLEGDVTVRRYCKALGLETDPRLLEALVLAYWLGYASYQLRTHADRRNQRAWVEGNLELVLRQVSPAASESPPAAVRGA